MNRRSRLAVTAAIAVVAAGATQSFAAGTSKPKPIKGTWSFTDVTPDPTVDASGDTSQHCHGKLPSAPTDVNVHVLKVKGRGTLTVIGKAVGDWAMELRDSHGQVLTGDDQNPPAQESVGWDVLSKRGATLQLVFCNLSGSPSASATYKFVYR